MDATDVLAWLVPIVVGAVAWISIDPWAGVVAAVGALGGVWLAPHGVP